MPWSHILTFLAGVLVGAATIVIWKLLRFAADLRAARHALESYVFPDCGVADELAHKAVENCKNRLRWQKNLNPEWLPPLVDEVPKLVREIAAIYHPGKQEALLAPGLSQFSRAVHLAAMDVADFLQTRSIGRLVDVSASTAIKTWEMTHKIATHEKCRPRTSGTNACCPTGRCCASNRPSCGPERGRLQRRRPHAPASGDRHHRQTHDRPLQRTFGQRNQRPQRRWTMKRRRGRCESQSFCCLKSCDYLKATAS
jgi:hypothetical protein